MRCTRKLLQFLRIQPDPGDEEPTSALGDWYGNLVVTPQGPPLMLFVSDRSALCVLLRPDASMPDGLQRRVVGLLRRLDLPAACVEREMFHLQKVRLGRTRSRRVVGTLNEAARRAEVSLAVGSRQEPGTPGEMERVEDLLAGAPYSMIDFARPRDMARDLLAATGTGRETGAASGQTGASGHESGPGVGPSGSAVREPGFAPALRLAATSPETAPDAASASTPVRPEMRADGPSAITPARPEIRGFEGRRVYFMLSAREREILVKHTMLDPDLVAGLKRVLPAAGEIGVSLTLEDLHGVLGALARAANRCRQVALRRELQGLHVRILAAMEGCQG